MRSAAAWKHADMAPAIRETEIWQHEQLQADCLQLTDARHAHNSSWLCVAIYLFRFLPTVMPPLDGQDGVRTDFK